MRDVVDKARIIRRLPRPPVARAIREDAGVSQEDIALALDPPVTRAAVSRWESGDRRPTGAHLEQYVRILEELGGVA